MREKAERANAVVDRDEHDAFAREVFTIVCGRGVRAEGETAAVDPDQHGQTFVRRFGRRPDVQIQAVFAYVPLAVTLVRIRREFVSLAHALPFRSRLGGTPAKITNGRR